MKGISEWLAGHRVVATLLGVALVALLAVPTVRDLLPAHVRTCLDAPRPVDGTLAERLGLER